ncbi:hypothetical protein [Salmonella enterica]|uniref:hypothetical protein n=1 Tax=Salmonella enterica TaxID=28901 RepID=UPI001482B190|nr:hypothetical protein [Salmonella enterica]EDR5696315.1 hypothetical protein [Salmonella enterica subsp. diarizonae]EDU6308478.1 hypothetical protein [Salmonella enterica subsp. diarizonae serovar 53:z10:z]EEJ4269365.1 hypothetical protein [Salmonella enterica subsp. diarizonae serovar 50:r:z]EDR6627625.1 hypothetical protein [Salmonella enterica subsp. diarizonae]EEJ4514085.1 hypothetical protein [Salmonella enterica subsp. diarizonae serovar 50:r:z]
MSKTLRILIRKDPPQPKTAQKKVAQTIHKKSTQFGTQIIRKIRVPLGLIAGVPWG